MAQLRSGILPLRIETGRFRGEDVNERICLLCEDNTVEDECHFLFHCKRYECIRERFFTTLSYEFNLLSDIDKMRYLFTHKPRQFAKYVITLFDCCKNVLFN